MKIGPNDPAFPSQGVHNELDRPTHFRHDGMPIRLAIAAQIMAAQCVDGFVPFSSDNHTSDDPQFRAERSLEWADALIEAHNRGQA